MGPLIQPALRRLQSLLPLVSSLLLVAFGLAPSGLPYFGLVGPALALMAVFYWSIFRADLMSMAGAFGIGLVVDLLSGGPLGLNALILLLTHELGVSQRRVFMGSSFFVNWWAFSMVALGAAVIGWVLASLLHWHVSPLGPVLTQLGLSLCCYPAVYWLLSRMERRLLRQSIPL